MLYPEDRVPTIPSNPQPLESPYGCPLNFPPDDYNLYNSALIYQLPPIESFSERYLRQTSQ